MSKQIDLNIKTEKKLETVEGFKFEPIKGYPMLQWKGKRPFTSTQFYPAQLKENHGEPMSGTNSKGAPVINWMNNIYWGDNLQVMSHLLKEFRGKVDLVSIDPPFDSSAEYTRTIRKGGSQISSNASVIEEKQYSDIWTNDQYLQFMYERLVLIRELLTDDGIITLHCDFNKNHHLRLIMDEIFGASNFVNDVIWYYENKPQFGFMKHLPRDHDTIFVYAKRFGEHCINHQQVPVKLVQQQAIVSWDPVLKKRVAKRDEAGKIIYETREEKYMGSVWTLPMVHPIAKERTGYPTQKPETLLDRIIKIYTKPGSLVFDPFMGSGTTLAVAMKLGRRFIGADINLGAIQTTTKRLLGVAAEIDSIKSQSDLKTGEDAKMISGFFSGFSVLNVNNYDVFRNPAQAKDLLIQALEIQPMPGNGLYDGEKDGRMVKIMPVNRISTKADLNDLLTGFDYKDFQKRAEKSPNKPVESLLLVCMGHEPDLSAYLRSQCQGFDLDIEVVDILRDKSNLEFKRDSQAEITIKKGVLKIEAFYPMNLLQKLSLMKENVKEWRELVESVMIDWNYDGAVFEPALVDVPEKEEFVKGEYSVPKDVGTIYVKITDLLSESLEMEVPRG
jgi:DNA modification methylase